MIKECLLAPIGSRHIGYVPAIVVETTDKHRQLGAKLHCFVWREAIAQRMQRRAKQTVSAELVVPIDGAHEFMEPLIGWLQGFIEGGSRSHEFFIANIDQFRRLPKHKDTTGEPPLVPLKLEPVAVLFRAAHLTPIQVCSY